MSTPTPARIRRWTRDAHAHGRTPNLAYLRARQRAAQDRRDRPWRRDMDRAADALEEMYRRSIEWLNTPPTPSTIVIRTGSSTTHIHTFKSPV